MFFIFSTLPKTCLYSVSPLLISVNPGARSKPLVGNGGLRGINSEVALRSTSHAAQQFLTQSMKSLQKRLPSPSGTHLAPGIPSALLATLPGLLLKLLLTWQNLNVGTCQDFVPIFSPLGPLISSRFTALTTADVWTIPESLSPTPDLSPELPVWMSNCPLPT